MLVRLKSPDWLAGMTFTITDGRITEAPHRFSWMLGRDTEWLREYLRIVKWTAGVVREPGTTADAPSVPQNATPPAS